MDKTLPTREELVKKLAGTFKNLGFSDTYSHVLASDYASLFSQIEQGKNLAAVEGARIASDRWGDPIDDGDCERNEGIDLAIEAIRSAAK